MESENNGICNAEQWDKNAFSRLWRVSDARSEGMRKECRGRYQRRLSSTFDDQVRRGSLTRVLCLNRNRLIRLAPKGRSFARKPLRGLSSIELPKLHTRVRFPSPAPSFPRPTVLVAPQTRMKNCISLSRRNDLVAVANFCAAARMSASHRRLSDERFMA